MAEEMIRLEGVGKTFPGSAYPAVADLSMDVDRGEVVTLVGPSGCGKTTTLKMINRIIEPTSGSIHVDGKDASQIEPHVLRRSIGYVIQQIGLFPHRTIRQNIATVPALLGWDESRIDDTIGRLIELVGLDDNMLERYPPELSGGQQQRVGVARALAADPPVLLMDEPFGAVDPIVRARLQDELLELQQRLKKTIVFVTHDIDEAIKLGDRIAILNVGGVLEQFDSPEKILREPAGSFVEHFIGGERGLKRLGLVTVDQVPLSGGPVVQVGASAAEARAVMSHSGTDWVVVVSQGRLVGWVGSDAMADSVIDRSAARPFALTLERSSSLRQALDAAVTSHSRVAVVVDGDRYLGLLDVDTIAAEITE